jgi:transposase
MNYMKVGIDASKEKLVCAYRANGVGEMKMVTLDNRQEAVKPWIENLQTQGVVQVCYEASSVGYSLYRWLSGWGAECAVVAPSLIPKKAGNHVKTDTRDAKELLRLFEAELLTSVHVPTVSEEALRDLVRSRGDMRKTLTQHKHRLNQLMQRHGRIYPGKAHWTQKHMNWIRQETLEEQAAEATKRFYLRWVEQSQGELERVDAMILEQAPKHKTTYALAQRFMGFYGIDVRSGISLASELLDPSRLEVYAKAVVVGAAARPLENPAGRS